MSPHLSRRLLGAVTTVALAAGLISLTAGPATAAAPSNDDFASATALTTGGVGTVQVGGSAVEATTEPGEPSHAPDGAIPTNSSIWYSYTPTTDGNLNLGVAAGAGQDTVLAVYTGSSLGSLVRVAGNDDALPGQTWSQLYSVPVAAGTTYRIAVASKTGQAWTSFTYGFGSRPWNDDIGTGLQFHPSSSITTWNVHATAEPGEAEIIPGQAPSRTLWWRYAPAHNGTLSLNTSGSSIDTVLGVFRQDTEAFAFAGLTRVAFNDDTPGGATSAIANQSLKGGRVYWIAVGGYNAAQGTVKLTNTWTPSAHPDNDDFADAFALHDGSTFFGSNSTATLEAYEPGHLSDGTTTARSVWYQFTPAVDGAITATFNSLSWDSAMALYRGTTLAGLERVAEHRGLAATPARPTGLRRVPVQAGQHYYLAIVGANSEFGSLDGTFRIGPRPTVSGLDSTGGPLAGGNWVEIRGTGFDGSATEVTFGGTAATDVTFVAGKDPGAVIRAQVPAGLPGGPVDVAVATHGGEAAVKPTYVVGQPTVGGMSVRYLRLAGGQTVRVSGTEFRGTPVVTIGGVAATGVTVHSSTSLTFVTPRRTAPGTVAVAVRTSHGTSPASSAARLTYLRAPVVTRLSRKSGPRRGGYAVRIHGRDLVAVSKVLVGRKAARFTLSGGRLTITMPKGRAGRRAYIRVVTPGGTSASVAAARFRYR